MKSITLQIPKNPTARAKPITKFFLTCVIIGTNMNNNPEIKPREPNIISKIGIIPCPKRSKLIVILVRITCNIDVIMTNEMIGIPHFLSLNSCNFILLRQLSKNT